MSKELDISEDKFLRVTYGVVGVLAVLLFGFGGWMTSVELNAKDLNKSIQSLEQSKDVSTATLISIDKRLSRIEVLLERNNRKRDH